MKDGVPYIETPAMNPHRQQHCWTLAMLHNLSWLVQGPNHMNNCDWPPEPVASSIGQRLLGTGILT